MTRNYHHLSRAERETIMRMRDRRISVGKIATELRRHPATIYRELRRNFYHDDDPYFRGYFGRVANDKAASRRVRGGKVGRNPRLAGRIVEHLVQCWTPEQIAGRLRLDEADPVTVCHETIYQFVYGVEGRQLGLWNHLPRQRKARRRRYARKPRGLNIPLANTIAERPKEIGERNQFGHWEGDLIAFRKEFGKANLTSLVERRSRYIVLAHNPSRHSKGVMTGIEHHLGTLPQTLRQSITFDRGTEFAAFATLKQSLGVTSYFCKPSAPWQKGSVENSNGRIRRFLPLDTNIAALPDVDLVALTQRLNDTPRKCLGFRTPAEVLREQITASVGS
jgi:IS30 family transposase